jgi:NADH-quinone oxidoreductase subunit N
VALAGYALVAAARTARAYEAAMRYFVQGAVATGLLAYGVAVLFGAFGGTLAFADFAPALQGAGR